MKKRSIVSLALACAASTACVAETSGIADEETATDEQSLVTAHLRDGFDPMMEPVIRLPRPPELRLPLTVSTLTLTTIEASEQCVWSRGPWFERDTLSAVSWSVIGGDPLASIEVFLDGARVHHVTTGANERRRGSATVPQPRFDVRNPGRTFTYEVRVTDVGGRTATLSRQAHAAAPAPNVRVTTAEILGPRRGAGRRTLRVAWDGHGAHILRVDLPTRPALARDVVLGPMPRMDRTSGTQDFTFDLTAEQWERWEAEGFYFAFQANASTAFCPALDLAHTTYTATPPALPATAPPPPRTLPDLVVEIGRHDGLSAPVTVCNRGTAHFTPGPELMMTIHPTGGFINRVNVAAYLPGGLAAGACRYLDDALIGISSGAGGGWLTPTSSVEVCIDTTERVTELIEWNNCTRRARGV